jgi:hypothetical protein
MDDRGPTISVRTQLAQLGKKRFELEWALPLEPGLSTHVTLFDFQCFPPHAVAAGEGADEAEALLDLWTSLTAQHGSAEGIAYVAAAYERRTGPPPERAGFDTE